MSARFMKYVNVGGNQVAIYIAAEVRHAGIRRVIDAIEPAALNDTVARVEYALASNTLLSTAQAGRTKSVTITSVSQSNVKLHFLINTGLCLMKVLQTRICTAQLLRCAG